MHMKPQRDTEEMPRPKHAMALCVHCRQMTFQRSNGAWELMFPKDRTRNNTVCFAREADQPHEPQRREET